MDDYNNIKATQRLWRSVMKYHTGTTMKERRDFFDKICRDTKPSDLNDFMEGEHPVAFLTRITGKNKTEDFHTGNFKKVYEGKKVKVCDFMDNPFKFGDQYRVDDLKQDYNGIDPRSMSFAEVSALPNPNVLSESIEDFEFEVVSLVHNTKTMYDITQGLNKGGNSDYPMKGGERTYPNGVAEGDDDDVESKIEGDPYGYDEKYTGKIQKARGTDSLTEDKLIPLVFKAIKRMIGKYKKQKESNDFFRNKSLEIKSDFQESFGQKPLDRADFLKSREVEDFYDTLPISNKDMFDFTEYIISKYDFMSED